MLCSGFTEQLKPCDPQGAQFSMALFFRWMRGLDKPSQVMISLIGQEWLPIRLIAATTHHAIAAQQGTSSVWHAAHDYSCWRGGSACCQGLFWGQPANRGAFLITVRDLETVLTLWARKPPWPRNQCARLVTVCRSKWLERCLCNLCSLVRDFEGSHVAQVFLLLPHSLKANNR